MIEKIQVVRTFEARFCSDILQTDFLIPLDPWISFTLWLYKIVLPLVFLTILYIYRHYSKIKLNNIEMFLEQNIIYYIEQSFYVLELPNICLQNTICQLDPDNRGSTVSTTLKQINCYIQC